MGHAIAFEERRDQTTRKAVRSSEFATARRKANAKTFSWFLNAQDWNLNPLANVAGRTGE
jgi:hypothetical protein